MSHSPETPPLEGVAVIGMSGRFPGAKSVAAFWENLKNGVDSIRIFSDEELEFSVATEEAKKQGAKFVKARAILDDVDLFDAEFFGIYPKEAQVMDPQHRIFLECAWETLEQAGYDPEAYRGLIGVYAGLSMNTYLLSNLCSNREFAENFSGSYQVGVYQIMLGNDKDFLPTRVSYKLNLKGPSMAVQTACSTSLVAVAQASQSLLNFQCDMALAGGVSVTFPQKRDYLYQEDGMVSADGTCRSFDASAHGTVFGHGAGVVLLKRLADAVTDGDHILAVIKGFAVNNDGSEKIGYAAPSVRSQVEVIAMAQASAGVSPESISYIEAHGTGTPLGDPIEIAALTQAFRASTEARGFCAIGTAKTNIGHLDVASGVTGLIKTVLSLQHQQLPPMLHFEKPNPEIDFANSPFYPVTKLTEWKSGPAPRRAGVSAFGVGGTNAHIVLEEPPRPQPPAASRPHQLLILSARTASALEQAATNLAAHLENNQDLNLADAAHTLQRGRRAFAHRRILVCRDVADASAKLKSMDDKSIFTYKKETENPPVVFMFPGQGSQHVDMGRDLYRSEPVFREAVDRCVGVLQARLGLDLRGVLYPDPPQREWAEKQIHQTFLTQPAIFVVEYALAQLWMSWGIRPAAMIGHSIGEYVAACLTGVFTLEDALNLLAERAQLMQNLPAGSMLAVRLPAEQITARVNGEVCLAAINSPSLSVVSGPTGILENLHRQLAEEKIVSKFLPTSHGFHSSMMDPILETFTERVKTTARNAPTTPWISTFTGRWVTAEEMSDPAYWSKQLRHTVRLTDAMRELLNDSRHVFLEVGPGQTLTTLIKQQSDQAAGRLAVASLPNSKGKDTDTASVLNALGRLWLSGVDVDWDSFCQNEKRSRVPLPTYPFERKRYWVEAVRSRKSQDVTALLTDRGCENAAPAVPENQEATTPAEIKQTAAPSASRKERIAEKAKAIIQTLSGIDPSQLGPTTLFLELGFDSLFLTQVSQAVQQQFGVKVTFRQLIADLSSVGAIAEYLDQKLPPEAFAESPAPAAAPQVPTASALDQIANQLQSLHHQLEELRTSAPVQPVVAAPALTEVEKDTKRFGPFKAIEKGAGGGLTPRQQKALDTLTERYNRRTAMSKRMAQEHRRHFCDPRAAGGFRQLWKEMVYPIVCARSKGSRIWDIDGNEYVDVTMGFGANYLGHSPDFVTHAVEEQLRKGFEIGPQSPLAGEVSRMICEFSGMERATFCNTGSEAVMAALRVCRTVTGRSKFVFFSSDYHGIFDEVLARAATINGRPGARPIAPGIPVENLGNVIVLEYGNPASLEILKTLLPEVAAVMVEPVQARHPDLQPREFLQELRRITEQAGTALIFDEIITGFRVHPGGAQAWFDVRADLATYGKVIGGGMPIGVLAGKAAYMDALDGGHWSYGDDSVPEVGVTFFAGTFVRHPLALAAAHAVLKHLKQAGPALQQTTNERTQKWVQRLNRFFEERRLPMRLQGFSSLFYYDFHPELKHAGLLFYYLRDRGVHIWEGRVGHLSVAHTDEDMDFLFRAFQESIDEMQKAGFLPEPGEAVSLPYSCELGDTAETPLTEAQKEMWLSTQMGDDANCAYNESNVLRFHGPLDQAQLEQALQQTVARHDALRSTFDPAGESQRFVPASSIRIDVPVHDFSRFSADEREAKVAGILAHEASTPFDLTHGPLLQVQLLKLDADDHRLVITAHHLVCDGWSFAALVHELAALYNAAVEKKQASLPEAVQFRTFAQTQTRERNSAEAAEAESYWVGQFAELPPVLELPTDRLRPAVKTYRGAMKSRRIGPDIFEPLKKTSAQRGNTIFATLFAAFNVLLHRLTGQEDLVIGVPAASQALVDNGDTLVGHCLNFLPIRVRVDASLPFRKFAVGARKTVLDAYDSQHFTYGSLLQKLKLPRDTGRLPLISAMFNIDKAGYDKLRFSGLKVEVATNAKRFVNSEIFFNLIQNEHDVMVECEYNTDLFDEATIERWLSYFENLICAIIEDDSRPLHRLPLLSPTEERKILVEWNDTATDYPREKSVIQLFEEQASTTPDAVAVIEEEQRLTYQELDERAKGLAAKLQESGVSPGDRVAICMDRSLELIISILGILKIGGAYVPLDPGMPAARLTYILEDTQASVLLTQEHLSTLLPQTKAKVLIFDNASFQGIPRSAFQNPHSPQAGDLAYVMYTSGSTGLPKGVCVPHRGIVRLVKNNNYLTFSPEDVFLLLAPPAFDASTFEIWGALLNGARLVIHRSPLNSLENFGMFLKQQGVTTLWLTAGLFHQIVEEDPAAIQPVRRLLAGGDVLSPPHIRKMKRGWNGELINGYGPTESTTFACCHRITEEDLDSPSIPIGRPISNTRAYILDCNLQPVPVGVTGELHIGGDGLALGYLNAPELTSEKFIADPFQSGGSARPTGASGRLYKTGDLARYRLDGRIEFLGRSDQQVKIRGFRVELGEVEAVLSQHPDIRESAVVACESLAAGKQLVGYVVLKNCKSPDIGDLRCFLSEKLPDYMVPSVFVTLDAIPLTPNGKVDRKSLPSPKTKGDENQNAYIDPRNETECRLAEIWSQLLGIEKIGARDNFFEIGGNSLLAVRVFSRIKKAFGRDFPLTTLFKYPTVERLARLIEGEKTDDSWSCLVPIQPEGTRPPIFWIHTLGGGGGGGIFRYKKVADLLGVDQPSYGIQAPSKPFEQMETMAAFYIKLIKTVQPSGPYRLAGYCFGGNVAYEMARQLHTAGDEVTFLGLIESGASPLPSGRLSWNPRTIALFMVNLWYWLADEVSRGPKHLWTHVWKILSRRSRRNVGVSGNDPDCPTLDEMMNLDEYPEEFRRHAETHWRAFLNYRPGTYDGALTLFRVKKQALMDFDPALGWGALTRAHLAVSIIPGSHEGVFDEPHVRGLVVWMKVALEKLETAGMPTSDTKAGCAKENTQTKFPAGVS